MDARESLAKGSCRDSDLYNHICADQWATAENSSFEPASSCFARSSIDGFDRRDDSRAGLPRGQLRHAGPVAWDDAYLRVSLSRALFRMGGRRCSEVLPHAATAIALSDAYVGSFIRAARQRHNLFDADAVGGCSHSPR